MHLTKNYLTSNQHNLVYNSMIASDSFVFPRECNPRISLIAHARGKFFLCFLNFSHVYDMQVGNLVEDKGFICLPIFPH